NPSVRLSAEIGQRQSRIFTGLQPQCIAGLQLRQEFFIILRGRRVDLCFQEPGREETNQECTETQASCTPHFAPPGGTGTRGGSGIIQVSNCPPSDASKNARL